MPLRLPFILLAAAAICTGASTAALAAAPEGYELVFEDEFSGAKLDISKWWTRFVYHGGMLDHFNDERQRFRENNNHVLSNGILSLVARQVRSQDSATNALPDFESGMIRSKKTYKYGYYEARMKVPAAKGVWPGFWLCGDTLADGVAYWPPEIDILELVNNGEGDDLPTRYHVGCIIHADKGQTNVWNGATVYKADDFYSTGHGGYLRADYSFADDWHVYGMLWDTDDTVAWFIDGRKFFAIKYNWLDKNGNEPPWPSVILGLGVGGAWAGRHGIDTAAFPQSLDIDWVRVWQKPAARNIRDTVVGKDLLK